MTVINFPTPEPPPEEEPVLSFEEFFDTEVADWKSEVADLDTLDGEGREQFWARVEDLRNRIIRWNEADYL
jgi:hypothetical protein